MKPPFFVGSRPCRAQSCAGGTVHNALRSSPLHQRRNKAALKQSLTLPFFHSDETCRPASSPSHSRKPVLLARAPTLLVITAICCTQSPDLPALPPKGCRKIGNLLRKQGDLFGKHPTFPPNPATYSGAARLFCGMTRLLLRFLVSLPPVPSNASSPFPHSSLVTSSPLCLPSVNSLSTTIAAP